MCLLQWSGKIFRFPEYRLLENAFVKLFLTPCMIGSLFPIQNIPHKFAQKRLFPPCNFFYRKKLPHTFFFLGKERSHYDLSSYFFQFLKVLFLTLVVQTMAFQAKLPSHCVFKVIQYGYEIFQTVLSLNCKIIYLKNLTS